MYGIGLDWRAVQVVEWEGGSLTFDSFEMNFNFFLLCDMS